MRQVLRRLLVKASPKRTGQDLAHSDHARQDLSRFQRGDRISLEAGAFQVLDVRYGGMGVVYAVRQEESGHLFALKTLHERLRGSVRATHRFRSECEVWVRMEKHPNIVKVFLLDELSGQPFLLMELIPRDEEGHISLRDWIKDEVLSLDDVLRIAIQACDGMIHATQKVPGLVHRDLKPENVLIAPGKTAKVTDFGLAVVAHEEGEIGGTPRYMAPEQRRGDAVDHRTDIYAFGAVLCEMLTGRLPLVGEELGRFFARYGQSGLKRTLGHRRDIPQALTGIVMTCLAQNPDERYQTFDELRVELAAIYHSLTGAQVSPPEGIGLTAWELVGQANCFLDLGFAEEARECAQEAVSLLPNSEVARVQLGLALCRLGRSSEGAAEFREAVRLDPEAHPAYQNLALALIEMRQYEEAIRICKQALRLAPNYALAHNTLGMALARLGRLRGAVRQFRRAVALRPDMIEARLNLGGRLLDARKPRAALTEFRKLIQLRPSAADAHYCLGVTLGVLGDLQGAARAYQEAIRLQPDHTSALHNLGTALHTLGQKQDAVIAFEEAIRLAPGLAESHYNLACTLEDLDHRLQAVQAYQRYLELTNGEAGHDTQRFLANWRLSQLQSD